LEVTIAGYQAYKAGRYLEAENYFVAALGRAEQFETAIRASSLRS